MKKKASKPKMKDGAMKAHAKSAHKMHKEILKHHSKLMDSHAKMEKHLQKMAGGGMAGGGAQISSGKRSEKSRPNKAEEVAMDEGKRGRKKPGGY